MDLGSMGIPRDIARLNANQNFLHTTANPIGPGDYSPNLDSTFKKAPVVGFGKVKGNYKSTQNQWEEQMEKYVGFRPGEKKIHIKEGTYSPMHSFE